MRIAILTTDNREHNRNYGAATPCFGTAPEALLEGFAKKTIAEIHVLSCSQRPMRSPEKLADNIWFHVLHVPKIGWLRTGYQGCIRAVRRRLRDIHPDIVHGQGTERDCAISAALSGYPNVVTLHGIMREQARLMSAVPFTFYWLAAKLEALVLSQTHGVFCNSAYTETVVATRARQTWRVANAVRQKFFETQRSISQTQKPVLLNVGTICQRKRQLDVLDLAEQLHRAGSSFEVFFVGTADTGDPYVKKFLRRIDDAASVGFARYLGSKELSSLIALFDSASALIHVPREEAFGLVVAEALTRNLKLFASDVGGIPDIAKGIEDAELFALEDRQSLQEAIAKWLDANCPRPQSAAAIMRERYHPEVIAQRHLEIYEEILERGQSQ